LRPAAEPAPAAAYTTAMASPNGEPKSGCGKFVGIGCGCLLLLMVLAGAVAAWQWPRIAALWSQGKAVVSEMLTLQAVMREKYGAESVNVRIQHRYGEEGATFTIELTNAAPLSGLSDDALREKALEVAATARDNFKTPAEYPRYEVVIVDSKGAGVTISTKRSFTFAASELPPPPSTDAH
jgi:hypothetical protein